MDENKHKKIFLPSVVPVKLLAKEISVSPAEVVKKLLESGVLATINESIDFDTAAIIADEFGYEVAEQKETEPEINLNVEGGKKIITRPPVVTVMGHVDHGKTKLLDAIRNTHITETESGGITQHIGAYKASVEIEEKGKKKEKIITFLDTPGHEAFSAMRAHGANVTDLVVLVVAADEGVKPQTVEAISHAKAAKVPIVVAINKIDKPEANPDRVKRELSEYNLVPEEWGGKTPMVPISAKTGQNIDELLEVIILSAELEDLKAAIDVPASGMVIESKVQPGKGALGSIIIRQGILKNSDVFVYDSDYAKVRFMEDWTGKRIKEAFPSDPVLVAGFKKAPKVGSTITVVENEKIAREISEKRAKEMSVKTIKKTSGLIGFSQEAGKEKINELKIILKADVKGSLEAIQGSLEEISGEGIKLTIASSGVGAVTESDINLAIASGATIIAFRVPIPPSVLKLAQANKVKISKYEIIYELINDVTAALEEILEPEIIETEIGSFEVIKVFYRDKERGIVGGKVISGKVTPGTKIKVYRNEEEVGELKTEAVKIGQEAVNQAVKGFEAGISYKGNIKIKPKDILKFILVEEKVRSLKKKS